MYQTYEFKSSKSPSFQLYLKFMRARKNDYSQTKIIPQLNTKTRIHQKQTFDNQLECPVCCRIQPYSAFKIFSSSCKHYFCQGCLSQHVQRRLNLFKEINCLESTCSKIADQNQKIVKEILTSDQRKKYIKILKKIQIDKSADKLRCPKEFCDGYILKNKSEFRCVDCRSEYCKKCMMVKHEGTCQNYGIKMIREQLRVQQCSRCWRVIEKIDGCNHMSCICGYNFCFVCGETFYQNHSCNINSETNIMTKNLDGVPSGCLKRALIKIITVVVYFFLLFPVDIFTCIILQILLVFWIILACFLGIFYRSIVQLQKQVTNTRQKSLKVGKILFFVLGFPIIIFPCVFLQTKDFLKFFRDNTEDKACFFLLKIIRQYKRMN